MNYKRKGLTRFIGVMLAVLLVLSDRSLTALAMEGSVSGGNAQGFVSVSGGTAAPGGEETPPENGTEVPDGEETPPESGAAVSDGDAGFSEGDASTSDSDATVSGGDATVSDGNAAVSGGDATVSDGNALPAGREPERFYEEPEPENYGTLAAYDAYSRTYHVEGNRYVTVIGNDGATYVDADGSLKEVDNTLVENPIAVMSFFGETPASYINAANDYTVILPDSLERETKKGITIVSGDYVMTLYPKEGDFTGGLVKDNAIRYSNVFSNIDYQYTVLGNSVKEDIILLEKTEKNSFSYYLDTCGLPAVMENNTLLVKDGEQIVFVLEAPQMEDASGEMSFGIRMELFEQDGMYLVKVTADKDWLHAKERVYPVRIDPSAIQVTGSAIRIACAEEGSPQTVIGDNQYPYVGYDDGITSGNYAGFGSRHLNCRSYFAIDYDFSALLAEAEIVSAAFQVVQKTRWSRGSSEFGLFGVGEPWEVSRLTWNGQAGFSHTFLDSQQASTERGAALSFDVTKEVSAWINGAAENHGFVMKAMVEAPNREAADAGVKMQCEVFYNNASAKYAPKLILSWTGELTDLDALTLSDTTIDLYPVVERNGDKSTHTLGVAAHGLAKPGSTVTYSLINGSTGETEAQESLLYPDSALYAEAFPTALSYSRRLSNWQSGVFTSLLPGQVYYVTAQASMDGETGELVTSDAFLIYEEGAFDLLPRIANHYGVDVGMIMADMQMQDTLTKEGNRIFIRNPQNAAPYSAGELSDYWKAVLDGLLMGRAENCEFGFEPINLNTGNFYMEQTDAYLSDIGGDFAFTRQYNSKGAGYKGSLGYGWSTPFDERLGELSDGTVLWLSGTGSIIAFTKTGEEYHAPFGQDYILRQEEEGYVLLDKKTNEKHFFNAYGLLTHFEDIYGNRTGLSYDMDYRLLAITSPSGKKYGITLDGENRITAIGLPDGKTIAYGYDRAGNLVTVTDEAGDTLSFSYDAAHRMTSWQDENKNKVITNVYDGEGRVTEQTDAEGGRVSLAYGEGRTVTTDANGSVTVYYYDGKYRTTRVEYPDGSVQSRAYNEAGYLYSLTDRLGVTTIYTYDTDGRLLVEKRQDGAERRYTYTSTGQLASFTEYDGGVTRYAYDGKNRPAALTDAAGNVTTYAYDEANRLISVTDAAGGVTSYAYEGACAVSKTDAEGNIWTYAYDAMNRQTLAIDPAGTATAKTYDEKGRCIAETDGMGNETRYTFDAAGNVIAITDREGQVSRFSYDKMNRMLQAVDPLSHTLCYTYDKNGNRLTETDAAGGTVFYTYDALNRLVETKDPEGGKRLYTYDGADRLLAVTDRRGYTCAYTYDDVKGALLVRTDERGNETAYETDSCGRITKIIYADGSCISYAYDRMGRVNSVTDQLGKTTQLSYDGLGNLLTIAESESRVYTYTYDRLGRLVKTVDPLGGTALYAYDETGALKAVTDERKGETAYTYDAAKRLISITDALGGVSTYAYDKEDRLLLQTTPEGRTTEYAYSAIGELVRRTQGEDREITYTYDALSRVVEIGDRTGSIAAYAYDKNGNITAVTDALGNAHSYAYDAEGNLLSDTYPNGEKESSSYLGTGEILSYTDRYGVVTTCTFDSMGRIIKAADSAGNVMCYEYDGAGNLTGQTDVLGRSALYEYDAYGRVCAITDTDGVKTLYAYDDLDRLVLVTDGAGNETAYTYDGAGNLTGMTKPGEAVYTYVYDALNRLTKKVDPEGAATEFVYDGDGSLRGVTDGNGIGTAYTYDALSRLVSYTDGNGGETLYSYDVRDNLLSVTTPEGNKERYGYDAVGNLLSVTDGMGETTHYAYDELYRLISRTSPLGAVESYTYDSHDVVKSVTDALGAITVYEVNANGLVTAVTQANGGVYTYAYDAVHRLVGITTPLGYEKTFTYNAAGDVLKEEDSLGRAVLYEYDVLHNLTRMTDAEGGVTAYAYDVRNNTVAMTNALGNTYAFAYDRVDRMITVTDPEEKAMVIAYDGAGNTTGVTAPGNRTTGYRYDNNYNIVAVTDGKGYTYHYTYDRDNRLVAAENPLGETAAYRYDASDRLTAYTDRMGLSESYRYDAHGNVSVYTAMDGLQTVYTYDKKDRLTSVKNPMGQTAYYSWDVMDNLTGVWDYEAGAQGGTRYTYDLEGNLTSITDSCGRTEQMTYDEAGRLTSYATNGGNTITYDYDKLNGLTEKAYTDATGESSAPPVRYAYDATGERVAMYDATGDTVYTRDALGRITSVTTYRTPGEEAAGDTVTYLYDDADNLSAIVYPDDTRVLYEYDYNDNLVKVTDRGGNATVYVYDEINRITQMHRPNGISTYYTYNARDQITELVNCCDDCEWVVSRYAYTYDDRGFIVEEKAEESLAGYAYDEKHGGKHEDGRHDELYPHGNSHKGKHDKDAGTGYQIVGTQRSFTYDAAGKLLSVTETEDNYGTYVYGYAYDGRGNRTGVVKRDENGKVVESCRYVYNDSSQLVSAELFDGKKTTSVFYTYDEDGNLISRTGRDGTDKVELTYAYTVEKRLEAVYDGKELLMAAAYDGDGNRVFQLNYNLHTDEDGKGNNGNGNGSNKDNAGSSANSAAAGSGNQDGGEAAAGGKVTGNGKIKTGNTNSSANNGKGGNGKNNEKGGNNGNGTGGHEDGGEAAGTAVSSATGTGGESTGNGNATNAESHNSQNQSGILFPADGEISSTEEYLISLIKTTGKEKNYELIEYINDVNREHTQTLVEQNGNGVMDTAYVYGASPGTGAERLSRNRFEGSAGYYLYDPRGSVSGLTNGEGQLTQSYRYGAFGEITFGAPRYENVYAYNGESYNPNIESQYLRARYYDVERATFLTEDFYPQDMWSLWDITEPLSLNRYGYCMGNPLYYVDRSGHSALPDWQQRQSWSWLIGEENVVKVEAGMETAKKGVLSFVSGAGTALARNASQLLEGPLAAIGYVSDNLSGKGTSWQESVNAVREWGNTYVREGAEEAENKSAYYLGNCAGDILAFVSVIAGAKGASSNSQGFSTGGSVTMVTPEGVVIVVDGEAVLEGVLVAPVGGYYTGETKAENIEEDWGNFWNSINGGFGSGGKGGAETNLPEQAGRGQSRGGRHEPANLNEKLAMEEAMTNPENGRSLEGKNTDPRWPAKEGWEKWTQNINGYEIHYEYNRLTGQIDDVKIK